jgi:DNA-binding transcriptional LysR family regulator
MELRHLRYFVAVAQESHFTRAARALGIGQPPLSQQIQQLEAEIGTALFRRLPRGVELTAAGEVFFREAKEILSHAARAVEHARRAARGELGRIRVGMINSAPFHPLIPRILREYRKKYPGVALTIEESSTPELATNVHDDILDIAFVRPLLGHDPYLAVEHLFDEKVLVVLPAGHPLTKYKSLKLEALSLERFVFFSRAVGAGLYDAIIAACQRAGFSPRIVQEALQVTSIVNLVAAGLGVSLVPASMQMIHSEGIAYRPIRGDAPLAKMSLIYRQGDSSPTVTNLVGLARELI